MLQTVDMDEESQPQHHLRAWREFRGFTQDGLAAEVGTTGSVIHLLENGQRGLSDKWLRRLAKPLKTMPGAILDYDPNTVPTAVLEAWSDVPDDMKPTVMSILKTFHRKAS